MATLQSGKCFTVPTFFGMCCRSEWQERMYIYKWHEVDQTKHEIFCVHIVCNEIQVKVNLEITTFFFYLRFPYCPNFFWFGVVHLFTFSWVRIVSAPLVLVDNNKRKWTQKNHKALHTTCGYISHLFKTYDSFTVCEEPHFGPNVRFSLLTLLAADHSLLAWKDGQRITT